ncbi:hypothetical protein [Paenibacillus vini]|uniref:Uncharacterized protein n=1 Tax=Paenibacillus vini TaxID=1476024 RepID=A0ABQ4MED1_9BACL|nr:hypothetical protein [Paenibacillus vini]GIP54322.1 hypothetical protein J42TS3_33570 [Paenibacillus vini]
MSVRLRNCDYFASESPETWLGRLLRQLRLVRLVRQLRQLRLVGYSGR